MAKKPANADKQPKTVPIPLEDYIAIINNNSIGVEFWQPPAKDKERFGDLLGIWPISRTTTTVVNPMGFTPLEKRLDEVFGCLTVIDVKPKRISPDDYSFEERRAKLRQRHIQYIKSTDAQEIIDILRKGI